MSHSEGVYYVRHYCDGSLVSAEHQPSQEKAFKTALDYPTHNQKCSTEVHLELRDYDRKNKLTSLSTWKYLSEGP